MRNSGTAEADPHFSEPAGHEPVDIPELRIGYGGPRAAARQPPTAHPRDYARVVPEPLPIDPLAEARRQWIAHGWSDAADGMTLVTSIMRAHQLLLARVEGTLKRFDLSFARFELLQLLSFTKDGIIPMASATARLQVHPTSITNTVQRLERDGLIAREPHPRDGRASMLLLTDAGRAVAAQATAALNSEVFTEPGMPRDDVASIVRALARFRESAGDFVTPPPAPDPL